MKSVLALLAFVSLSAQAQVSIPEFAGAVAGSIEDVHCTTAAKRGFEDWVTVVDRVRNDHFVSGMVLNAHWYDENGQYHFADFTVVVANYDVEAGTLQVVATSPKKNALELKININDNTALMWMNGKPQAGPTFRCEAPIAG